VPTPDILSRFGAVLLDMNGTLMFGGDRFGPDQDYAATYRTLGGSRLAPDVVQVTIPACYETMERIYNDPEIPSPTSWCVTCWSWCDARPAA
jgi:putative hydrolase of the HAD superfamily